MSGRVEEVFVSVVVEIAGDCDPSLPPSREIEIARPVDEPSVLVDEQVVAVGFDESAPRIFPSAHVGYQTLVTNRSGRVSPFASVSQRTSRCG